MQVRKDESFDMMIGLVVNGELRPELWKKRRICNEQAARRRGAFEYH